MSTAGRARVGSTAPIAATPICGTLRPRPVRGETGMITTESIGLAEARQAMEAILTALTPQDNPVSIAVADVHGDLIACLRQDGAAARMVRRSRAKAYSAATQGIDTVVFRDRMKAGGRTLDDWGDEHLTALQGGLAVSHNGRVVGAIAMSGNNTKRDEELAGIGRAAMKLEAEPPSGQQGEG